jgi:hypothetical protein
LNQKSVQPTHHKKVMRTHHKKVMRTNEISKKIHSPSADSGQDLLCTLEIVEKFADFVQTNSPFVLFFIPPTGVTNTHVAGFFELCIYGYICITPDYYFFEDTFAPFLQNLNFAQG